MKYLRIFIIIFLIPFIALAEECDVSNITITSMKPNKIEGNTEVISDPTFEDRTINLDLKMYEVGDSITYNMIIKNDSDEDYMIDEDTFKTDSDYIEYSLKTNDNTNVVKANSTKEVSLIVTYKKEIEDDKLTNNKFNASNSLKLSLNTSEKEQPLDIITTDNIKEVKNPVTSVSSMLLISTILLTTILIIHILIKRKNKYTKYLLIVLSMILIPTVYAICKCDIEVESTIEIEKITKLYDTIASLSKEESACLTKYEGEVTDEVGKTVNASNVYFDKCSDKRNIIFGGFCWQVIRTTETSGVKMIYNGEPVDGKCESARPNHKGIVEVFLTSTQTINTSYLYGSSFTYDTTNNTFTLVDTETATWSDLTYEDLIGKFTCKSNSNTCTDIYQINSYYSNTVANLSKYTIADTSYAQIGVSSFNANKNSPAMVGYMFNKVQTFNIKQRDANTYKYGSSFTYDTRTNTYTLSGITQNISDWSASDGAINDTHYTCWNTTGNCSIISYIYYIEPSSSAAVYFDISEGKSINDILSEMLFSEDVNKYNSSIKGVIDNWYNQNLSDYTNSLEDTVYCNARNITNMGGWNSNGGSIASALEFKNYNNTTNLACPNETDQFSVSNNKAKLTYPVGLLQNEENFNINTPSLMATGYEYWANSPICFYDFFAYANSIYSNGDTGFNIVNTANGVRPVVSLKSDIVITEGSGSEEDPWIIK